ncbi:hypothetical protein HYZ98_00365 [Candidatus Peregrinibacteria bacterium]|nr:hypothetical protein [Candidatus Peregrinibacteria bacterium]
MHRIIAFVLAASPRTGGREEMIEIKSLQSAPHYLSSSVPPQYIKGKEGECLIKAYPPNVLLVEASRTVENVFSSAAFEAKEELLTACHTIVEKRRGSEQLREEYAIAVVDQYKGDPEEFLVHGSQIASFLKSERLPLDPAEVSHTLESQLKYAKDDLVIVDWDGAFVFDPSGDVQSVVELLQLANLQLLQYRVLDSELDRRLARANKLVQGRKRHWLWDRELSKSFEEAIRLRARSIADFDALEREVKLIGDWYSARLYGLATKKFRLSQWRESIKEKLDSLEDIYSIISENFSVTKLHFLEMVQILLFFVLQVGWFVLIVLEFKIFLREI